MPYMVQFCKPLQCHLLPFSAQFIIFSYPSFMLFLSTGAPAVPNIWNALPSDNYMVGPSGHSGLSSHVTSSERPFLVNLCERANPLTHPNYALTSYSDLLSSDRQSLCEITHSMSGSPLKGVKRTESFSALFASVAKYLAQLSGMEQV